MASNVRSRLSLAFSDSTDFYPPKHLSSTSYESSTETKRLEAEGISAATTGTTIELGTFSTITHCMIRNLDTTNYVIAKFRVAIGSQAAGDFDLAANDTPETITDNGSNGTLVTNGSAVGRYVRLASAEDSGNDGRYLISQTTTDVITLAVGTALSTDNTQDTTVTLAFEAEVEVKIPAAPAAGTPAFVFLPDVKPIGDLVLTADTAAGS